MREPSCRNAVVFGAMVLLPALALAQPAADGAAIAAKGGSQGAAACVACHGAQGEGNPSAGFPRLAGLPQGYVTAQLEHFADGSRQNAVMAPVARQLTAAERTAVAAYFARLPAPAAVNAPATFTPADTGAWLAERGRWDQNLPACVQCHGPGGIGVGDAFPPLAGQSAAYLTAQLKAFKGRTRPGGPDNLMATVAAKMSDADVTAVSSHFAAAAPAPAAPAAGKESK
jgi:cytochrome c553